jgi:hypothetical protein
MSRVSARQGSPTDEIGVESLNKRSGTRHVRAGGTLTFKDGKAGRSCTGFRRVGRPQRGGYDSLMGGVLCAPPGKTIGEVDISTFIDNARLQSPVR